MSSTGLKGIELQIPLSLALCIVKAIHKSSARSSLPFKIAKRSVTVDKLPWALAKAISESLLPDALETAEMRSRSLIITNHKSLKIDTMMNSPFLAFNEQIENFDFSPFATFRKSNAPKI